LATGTSLVLNAWVHIGHTYSPTNGIQYSTSYASSHTAANGVVYLTIGSNYGANVYAPQYGGVFNETLYEFYIFSRELIAAEFSPSKSLKDLSDIYL
jgi:hypothetical protein